MIKEENIKIEKYLVCSNEDYPEKICFTLQEAIKNTPNYIDIFDEDGNFIIAYKYDEKTNKYTTNF